MGCSFERMFTVGKLLSDSIPRYREMMTLRLMGQTPLSSYLKNLSQPLQPSGTYHSGKPAAIHGGAKASTAKRLKLTEGRHHSNSLFFFLFFFFFFVFQFGNQVCFIQECTLCFLDVMPSHSSQTTTACERDFYVHQESQKCTGSL